MKPNELEPLVGERVGGDGGSGHKSLSRRVQQFSGKWYGLLVSCFYALMSIIMTLVNKVVFTSYGFHFPMVLFVSQMCVSLVLLVLFKRIGLISYADWRLDMARALAPLSVFFVGMVLSGLAALAVVNVPMYSALRKQTTLVVMLKEYLVLGNSSPPSIIASVLVMASGTLIAGWNDLNASAWGYCMVLCCCVVTASYTVTVKKLSQTYDVSVFGLLFYNTVLSLPFVVAAAVATGQLQQSWSFELWHDPGFLSAFLVSSVAAFGLNYAIYLCTRVNSPLTTSVTGDLKNIATDTVGLFAFPDVILTAGYLLGIVVATCGGVLYSYFKYQNMPSAHEQDDSESEV